MSVNLPITMPRKPLVMALSEMAPAVIALVQPNCANNDLKNTPKVMNVPQAVIHVTKPARTMT